MLDVQCSMFDVHQFLFDQTGRSATSGWAGTLTPDTLYETTFKYLAELAEHTELF